MTVFPLRQRIERNAQEKPNWEHNQERYKSEELFWGSRLFVTHTHRKSYVEQSRSFCAITDKLSRHGRHEEHKTSSMCCWVKHPFIHEMVRPNLQYHQYVWHKRAGDSPGILSRTILNFLTLWRSWEKHHFPMWQWSRTFSHDQVVTSLVRKRKWNNFHWKKIARKVVFYYSATVTAITAHASVIKALMSCENQA